MENETQKLDETGNLHKPPVSRSAVSQELIKRSIGISQCITEAVKNRLPTRIIKMYAEESERISKEFNRHFC